MASGQICPVAYSSLLYGLEADSAGTEVFSQGKGPDRGCSWQDAAAEGRDGRSGNRFSGLSFVTNGVSVLRESFPGTVGFVPQGRITQVYKLILATQVTEAVLCAKSA